MRTAILAGRIAVVRSGCVLFFVCLTEDSDLANDFLFIFDWTIRSDSAWSKKTGYCCTQDDVMTSAFDS